MIEREE